MIRKLFFGILGLVVILAIIISLQPSSFRISRTGTFNAPVGAVFNQVNNLHNWDNWSPWAKLDPHATSSFEGSAEGVGSIMRWAGNDEVGVGSMTITESRPHQLVKFDLEFQKPFEAKNVSEFAFTESAGVTTVTWTMSGTNNFIGKAMSLVFNCDKMVGDQFEEGFQNLRSLVESLGVDSNAHLDAPNSLTSK